jgi:hypothetical protein
MKVLEEALYDETYKTIYNDALARIN